MYKHQCYKLRKVQNYKARAVCHSQRASLNSSTQRDHDGASHLTNQPTDQQPANRATTNQPTVELRNHYLQAALGYTTNASKRQQLQDKDEDDNPDDEDRIRNNVVWEGSIARQWSRQQQLDDILTSALQE